MVPAIVLLLCLGFGVVLSAVEGWTVWAGFQYVLQTICGLGLPLSEVTPQTPHGKLLGFITAIAAQGLIGAIIGILCGVGPLLRAVSRFEQLRCSGKPPAAPLSRRRKRARGRLLRNKADKKRCQNRSNSSKVVPPVVVTSRSREISSSNNTSNR